MAKDKESKPAENSNAEKPKSCFIVTPIGQPNSDINLKAFGLIKAVIKPVLQKFNYEPIAASDISSPGSINKQIIIRLYEDELVIANLTGLNPNVMYELAVRHAVKKPVIIMAENGTKLPFDLVDQRCIFYDDSLHGVELAKEALESFLSNTFMEATISNPIYDSIKESHILKTVSDTDEEPIKYLISRIDRMETSLSRFSNLATVNLRDLQTFTTRNNISKGGESNQIELRLKSVDLGFDATITHIIDVLNQAKIPQDAYSFNMSLHELSMFVSKDYLPIVKLILRKDPLLFDVHEA